MAVPESTFFALYFFFAAASVYVKYIESKLYYLLKAIPVLGLFVYLFYSIEKSSSVLLLTESTRGSLFYIQVALFFGLLGDIFLLKKKLFLPGLASFLTGHIFYIAAFFLPYTLISYFWMILFLAIGFIYFYFFSFNYKKQGGKNKILVIAILIYILIMALMIFHSTHYAFRSGEGIPRFWMFFIAPVFFGISDALIGWYYFVQKRDWMKNAISIFYYSAQGLFVYGAIQNWL